MGGSENKMGAAEKLPELEALKDAISPTFSHEELRARLPMLEAICEGRPTLRLGGTAAQYRNDLRAASEVLVALSYLGARMVASAAGDAELARKFEVVLPRVQHRIRVMRAVNAIALSDTGELGSEEPEVLAEAQDILRRCGDEISEALSPGDRAELTDTRLADPSALMSWLDAP